MPAPREFLAGRNAVREALVARRRRIYRVLLAEGLATREILDEITRLCSTAGIPQTLMPRASLDALSAGVRHQGVLAEVAPYPYSSLTEILERAQTAQQLAFILVLDNLQDPQNVGSLLRSAEATGVHGVVVHAQQAVGITPAVSRASVGAVEHLHISAETNLAQTLRWLKGQGVWIVGVEEDARAEDYRSLSYDMPLALVVGSEGAGLRRLTLELCDFVVRIPMLGQVHSLNAAIASSLVLYQAASARGAL